MKKTLAYIVGFYVFLFLMASWNGLSEDFSLNPNDYARITDMEYTAVVMDEPDSQGSVLVRERITFDVHAASRSNPFWELWRDLPEDYVDGVKVDYDVLSVNQIMEDGTVIPWAESPQLYWDDNDYINTYRGLGPEKWYHSKGPYDEDYRRYECIFFYIDGVYREEMTFEITYVMHNAALRYNDCSDLYLALYSGDTCKYLESFRAQILFPNKDMPSSGNYQVYTYGTNSNDFPVTESATANPGYYTFSFALDKEDLQFKPYNEYIEFDLVSYGEDKHIFTEYAPDNYYSYDDVLDEIYEEQKDYADAPGKARAGKIVVFLICVVIAAFIILRNFTTDNRMKKKHTFYKPAVDWDYYREIPSDLDPKFAAALVFCKERAPKDDSGIYSALLMSLARKEYISFGEMDVEDVRIIINRDALAASSVTLTGPTAVTTEAATETAEIPARTYESLTPCEEYYLNLLVRHAVGNSVSMNYVQARVASDYEETAAFVKNMDKSIVNIGIKEGFFQKADYLQPKKELRSSALTHLICGFLMLIVVNLISYQTRLDLAFGGFTLLGLCLVVNALYLYKQASEYVLLTQLGEDEYAKWRGLYRFLNSDTLMHERTYVELPLWEKYLVYAAAFGIADKVNVAISIRCPEIENTPSPVLGNSYCRSSHIRVHSRGFRSAIRTGSFGSGGSFGGGGFGYGGGGRGGGGGGGGH
ncbi:MAG: DUF2207 domain-containing protein [Lachnospiraceae bacterium]|nr:DUF2207 domain-containing protein [Lachnospiraceae bacterium]